jgi:hypothetical protein
MHAQAHPERILNKPMTSTDTIHGQVWQSMPQCSTKKSLATFNERRR